MSTRVQPIYSNNIDISTGEIITLGTAGKSVATADNPSGAARRALRFKLQAVARRLLPKEQVAQCMHRCGQGGVAVQLSPSTGIASFSGVATCGSVWHCPVCSAKITNSRRAEANEALSWSHKMGYQVLLLTLTARHGLDDDLSDLLPAMKLAKQKFHQSREWRGIARRLVGHITATEVTHGAAGWHVHYHMILIVDAGSQRAALSMFNFDEIWLRSLEKVGLSGNGHAYSVQDASMAGDYVSKWGAAEEVTLTNSKTARSGKGRTPWELLAAAGEGDQEAARLFVVYAQEFKGRRQLVWSRGLKRLLSIAEKSDEELAQAPEADDWVEVAIVPKQIWRLVVRRNLQAELLEVAEEGGGHYVRIWLEALQLQTRMKQGGG